MAKTNQYGLKRYIGADIKSIVRERCGYGCVICGAIPVEYDHLEVPFADAKEHDPDDLVTLCDNHHKKKGAGLLDVGSIRAALAHKQGTNSETRFKLDATKADFMFDWCGNQIDSLDNTIVIDGVPVLGLRRTDNPLEPIVISGSFHDINGNAICTIIDNEFVTKNTTVGDIIMTANRFKYRLPDKRKGLSFELTSDALSISYIFHARDDAYVFGQNGVLKIGNRYAGIEAVECSFWGAQSAILVESTTDGFTFADHDIECLPRNQHIRTGFGSFDPKVRSARACISIR